MQFSSRLFAALVLACSTSLAAASPLADYNLILFGDFDVSGGSGHVHGTAFIGGDLNGTSSEFGADLSKSSSGNTVEVAGDLNANLVTVQAGYLAYGGNNNLGSVNCNGDGLSSGACVQSASGLDAKASALYTLLSTESAYYAGLTTTGTVDLVSKVLSYTGEATSLAVFSIDGSDLFSQNSNWSLDFGDAEYVVINVYGVDLTSEGGINLIGDFSIANASNILWNFVDATSIDLGSTQWFGSILAVDASVDTSNDINGTLVADSYVGNGQTHIANWGWEPPTEELSEPSIYLLLMLGLGLFGLGRVIRRKQQG